MTYRIPIKFMDKDGRITNNPKDSPVIEFYFRYDPLHETSSGIISPWLEEQRAYGLVDTGADQNCADKLLIEKAKCPVVGSFTLQSSNDISSVTSHACHLYFPSQNLQISAEVAGTNIKSTGQKFDLLIGRTILSLGKLMMDYKSNIFYFEI